MNQIQRSEVSGKKSFQPSSSKSVSQRSYITTKSQNCPLCDNAHGIYACPVFRGKSAKERFKIIKEKSICLLCLKGNHKVSECKSDPKYKCRCGKSHHYLLHFSSENILVTNNSDNTNPSFNVPHAESPSIEESETQRSFSCTNTQRRKFIVLPTALVSFNCSGITGKLRVLLDSCSQVTMIRDSFVSQYSLPIQRSSIASSVKGIGDNELSVDKNVQFQLYSRFNQFSLNITADIVPANTFEYSSNLSMDSDSLAKLRNFRLADPNYNKSADVDLILGAEYFEQIMLPKTNRVDNLFLRETQFGWTISGPVIEKSTINKFCGFISQELEVQVEKFWKLEDIPEESSDDSLTKFEKCVDLFHKNLSVASDGRFVVKLPFRINPVVIDSNRRNALAALYRLESRLVPELKMAYTKFLAEYENLGHMTKVSPTNEQHYFLPHHAVLKESLTTPLRVVFNASSCERGKSSLNELLLAGPTIQSELFELLVNNRRYPFVFSADIEKMYRMIWVAPEHRCFQRILWRSSISESVSEYELNTVTYGTVPASYLATACLGVIASDIEHEHPAAATCLRKNFYMDDIICGSDSVEELVSLQKVIHSSLQKYGFILRKYVANNDSILRNIDSNLLSNSINSQILNNTSSAILGLVWNHTDDTYQIKINVPICSEAMKFTRRLVLSIISRTFDPLGFLSPVTIKGKLILQCLWKPGQSWDDAISPDIAEEFVNYISQLHILSSFRIPRYLNLLNNSELIGFCDASEKAYCAVIYLRTVSLSNNLTTCTLVCSKTRLAPLKKLTIPRLELQAAVLLTTLVDRLSTIFGISRNRITAFTDSSTVLCWLSKPPTEWKPFVHNRVSKIISSLSFDHWNYVPTAINPADLATRGIPANELLKHKNWIHGPEFLSTSSSLNIFTLPCQDLQLALEKRKTKAVSLMSVKTFNILEYYSSYLKLVKSICYLIRFINYRFRRMAVCNRPIDCIEFQKGLLVAIRIHQNQYFESEISRLSNNQTIKSKSKLLTLTPYLDKDNLLRVGGRLQNAPISTSRRSPIILAAKSNFTIIVCRYLHQRYFHSNIAFVSNLVSEHYWIVGGRNKVIKSVIRTCLVCQKSKAELGRQLMGTLPTARVTPSRPFTESGVDFAGPFECKCVNHRSTKFFKIYLAVFIYPKTRAVHLEVVSCLSTEAFISTLQRFISRRGRPSSMFSDNGTNFVGTANILKFQRNLVEFGTKENIKWTFSPPQSPHHGGMWEAAVKTAKVFLVRLMRNQVLNYKEYNTLFTRIEAIMNSRPLCYRMSNDQGTEIITPGHFLVGSSLLENASLEEDYIATTRRLQLLHNLINGFWKVWNVDYLHQLQQRYKWKKVRPNLEIGMLVLVCEPGSKPFQRPLGKIMQVYPDKQGLVRIFDVLVRGKVKRRSVTTVVPLQLAD